MRFGARELVFLLLLLCIPVAAYFVVYKPRNIQMAEARAEMARKQAKLVQLEAETRRISDLGEEIDKLTEAIALFEQKLPAQREEQVILKEVAELAAAHKLRVTSVRTDRINRNANYAELPLRMVITGDFDGFYSFLIELERLQRITRTPEMILRKAPNERDGQMRADVVLSIFFEGERSAPPARENRS
jgi:type IV pilus assembly protein PilO